MVSENRPMLSDSYRGHLDNVAELLQALRERLQLSREVFSRLIGQNTRKLESIEGGRQRLPYTWLKAIQSLPGVSCNDISMLRKAIQAADQVRHDFYAVKPVNAGEHIFSAIEEITVRRWTTDVGGMIASVEMYPADSERLDRSSGFSITVPGLTEEEGVKLGRILMRLYATKLDQHMFAKRQFEADLKAAGLFD